MWLAKNVKCARTNCAPPYNLHNLNVLSARLAVETKMTRARASVPLDTTHTLSYAPRARFGDNYKHCLVRWEAMLVLSRQPPPLLLPTAAMLPSVRASVLCNTFGLHGCS